MAEGTFSAQRFTFVCDNPHLISNFHTAFAKSLESNVIGGGGPAYKERLSFGQVLA